MSKIFDEFIEGTKTVADVAIKKASKVVDFSKLKFNAADLNRKISNIYEKIGRATYDSAKNNVDKTEEINQHIAAIDNLYIQLDAVNNKISSLSDKKHNCTCNCKNSTGIKSEVCNSQGDTADLNAEISEK